MSDGDFGKTLVIQPLPGIGDMVWHLPHIHAIAERAAGGVVSLLTKRRSLAPEIFAGDPTVDDYLWLDRDGRHAGVGGLSRLVGDLRANRFDTAWVLHKSARYALAARLAGIPRRLGYAHGIASIAYSESLRLGRDAARAHPIDKADRLCDHLGLTEREPEPRLRAESQARERLLACHRHRPRPWVAVGIGSSEPYKQWGAERFTALCRALGTASDGPSLFLIGGPAEQAMAETIVSGVGTGPGVRLASVGGALRDAVALISLCDLFVGNDTGTMNLAAATGVTAIGLFGGSPPLVHSGRIQPLLPDGGEPPRTGLDQMQRISVATVVDAVASALRDRP